MADIYNAAPGVVAVFDNQKVIPGKIYLPDFQPVSGLIEGIDVSQSVNKQIQPSLDLAVFIYVFGDQVGDILVRGKAFSSMCNSDTNGLSELIQFYNENRASQRPDPISVVVGSETITGFLVGLRIRAEATASDPDGLMSGYGLIINSLPPSSGG